MEAGHLVSSVRRQGIAFLGVGTSDSGRFAKDAHSAASSVGKGRHGAARDPSPSSPESGVFLDDVGTVPVPGARRAAQMGGGTRIRVEGPGPGKHYIRAVG